MNHKPSSIPAFSRKYQMTFVYLIRRNMRLVAEYTFVFDEGLKGDYSRFIAELIKAF